jgi:hypothetical protein
MERDATWCAITASKQVARCKLKGLPWREKLHRMDAMRERQEILRSKLRRTRGRELAC